MATVTLGIVGVIMVSSATGPMDGGGPGKLAVLFTVLGFAVMYAVSRASLDLIRRLTPVFLALSIALLTITLIPGLGTQANGAVRYLVIGPLAFEPAEIAKLAIVLYGAHLLAMRPATFGSGRALVPYLLVSGLSLELILMEPDLGTGLVVSLTVGALIFAAGAPGGSLVKILTTIVVSSGLLLVVDPYRFSSFVPRVLSHRGNEGFGFEAEQAELALGSGGIFGKGLGEGIAKHFYLPEVDTSMIAASLGEEMGFIGLVILCALFVAIAFAGLCIAQRAEDRFARLVAVGGTSLVLFQAIVNLSSVVGLLAPSGTRLPFISRGNVGLLIMFCALGLVLAVARRSSTPQLASTSRRAFS